jgi:integrase
LYHLPVLFGKVATMGKKKEKEEPKKRLSTSFSYNGQRYYVKGHSKKEILDKICKKKEELEQGTEDRVNPTLNAYYKRFTDHRRTKVKESTILCQSFQFRNCADIAVDKTGLTLGEMRIRDIKPYDIQTVQAELEKSKRKTETVNNCMAHLSHVFNAAVRDETITRNPCKCIERVKRTEEPARETIHRALTTEETKAFFEAAKGSYYENMFKLMIQTGIRVGEMAAINAFDVDSKEMMLHINKTVTRDEIGAYSVGKTPKTDAGNRDIPLTEQALESIKAQKVLNRQIFENVSHDTIFRSVEGALLREYQVNREIKRICKEAGIEKFTCHAFRATFATRFIEQRPQDYKVLSEILGHSNIKITLNLYTHVMKESKITAMKAVEIAI